MSTLELSNYGMTPLETTELEQTDGGWVGIVAVVVGAIILDWPNFKRGLAGRPPLEEQK